MFKIGEFARFNRTTVKALRHYDALGLLQPGEVDAFTGYRYYTAEQMPRLSRILAMRDLGFSLEEIRLVLDRDPDAAGWSDLLAYKHAEIRAHLSAEQDRLARIEALMKRQERGGISVSQDVVVKKVDPVQVASIRAIIPDYGEQQPLWDEIFSWMERNHVKMAPPLTAVFFDIGYKDSQVDVEVACPIASTAPGAGRVVVRMLPGATEMATVVHTGPYESMPSTYAALMHWIEDNRYAIVGPNRELYWKTPGESADASEFVTEIQIPIVKREQTSTR